MLKLDLSQAVKQAVFLFSQGGVEKLAHRDYARTVKLAKVYKQMRTGEDMDDLYQAYDPRETKKDLEQSIRLTNPLTPAVTSALEAPLRKLANVIPKVHMVAYAGDKAGAKSKAARDKLDAIYGDNNLTALFTKSFVDAGLQDPNAFVVLDYIQPDGTKEESKREVVHVIYHSADVLNFQYTADVLQWLLVRVPIKVALRDNKFRDGWEYRLYTADHHVVFREIDHTQHKNKKERVLLNEFGQEVTVDRMTNEVLYFLASKSSAFSVHLYQQKTGRVPAFRLGHKRDAYTDGRTCVNLWHPAYWHLRRLVKLGRENDLSYALRAILQKLSYATPCPAKGCDKGFDVDGVACGTCKGTGKVEHTTTSDHITLTLPRNPTEKDNMVDLAKLVHYVNVPTDIVSLQDDKIKETITQAFQAVYNSDTYVTESNARTATEKRIDMTAIYDAMQDAASWWSSSYEDAAYVALSYWNMGQGATVIHKFPRDFSFESTADLMAMLKEAEAAPGTEAMKIELTRKLNEHHFQDDAGQLARVEAMTRLDPFVGKSTDTVLSIFGQGLTTRFNKVLWSNMSLVLDEAEQVDGFYSLAHPKQREVVAGIVNGIIVQMEAEQPQSVTRLTLGENGGD